MTRTLGLLLIAMILTAASCDGSTSTEPRDSEPLELTTIVQRSIPAGSGGTVREVIRDQAAFTAAWSDLGLSEAPPAVDFSQEMVIVAAMETQPCVSKVTIRAAVQVGGVLVIDLLEEPPAPNCICITAERPVHVVRLRRAAGPARFNVERGQTAC